MSKEEPYFWPSLYEEINFACLIQNQQLNLNLIVGQSFHEKTHLAWQRQMSSLGEAWILTAKEKFYLNYAFIQIYDSCKYLKSKLFSRKKQIKLNLNLIVGQSFLEKINLAWVP